MVKEYVGGYEDWLRQRQSNASIADSTNRPGRRCDAPRPTRESPAAAASPAKKLSYKEQREFDALPARIEALEAEQRDDRRHVADPQLLQAARRRRLPRRLERAEEIVARARRALRALGCARFAIDVTRFVWFLCCLGPIRLEFHRLVPWLGHPQSDRERSLASHQEPRTRNGPGTRNGPSTKSPEN